MNHLNSIFENAEREKKLWKVTGQRRNILWFQIANKDVCEIVEYDEH